MGFFKRDKKKSKGKGTRSSSSKDIPSSTGTTGASDSPEAADRPHESSPQRVGIVSGILTTSATSGNPSLVGEIVDRHFAPTGERGEQHKEESTETDLKRPAALPPQGEHLRAVEPLLESETDSPNLEIDPMAHVGHATTIVGSIVAEEDLEIQGTIEGSVRLTNHQLTVGCDGLVKASVEANTVLVIGRISGDVVAADLVEIKAGGVIGGDVKSRRVIMHDGGVVVGSLDMSASLPNSGDVKKADSEWPAMPERPKLKSVEPLRGDASSDEGSA